MKLTICFIISAIFFTPILGSFWIFGHSIPYREGPGPLVTHLEIGLGLDFCCHVPQLSSSSCKRKSWIGKRDVRLGRWSPDHSMVYFRGKTYEFTANNVRHYGGGIGRYNPLDCPVTRSDAGHSLCTSSQATALAESYHRDHSYDVWSDNCHYFAEWLINKLLNNECSIAAPAAAPAADTVAVIALG